jgi:hypothetical protein
MNDLADFFLLEFMVIKNTITDRVKKEEKDRKNFEKKL